MSDISEYEAPMSVAKSSHSAFVRSSWPTESSKLANTDVTGSGVTPEQDVAEVCFTATCTF